MKDETKQWLNYADENLQSSKILLESHLYNPSLQNSQQCIEKYILISSGTQMIPLADPATEEANLLI